MTYTTTVYDQFNLRADDGRLLTFSLADFYVRAAEGHVLTVVQAIRGRRHWDFAVINHSTGEGFFRFQSWGLFLGGFRLLAVGLTALFLGCALLLTLGAVALAIPVAVWFATYVFTNRNIRTVRRRLLATRP